MRETLLGLVSRYSPSGQEHEAVMWLVERMRALGFTEAFVDGAGNAIGVMSRSSAGGRQVVLLGHIDTVPGEIKVRIERDEQGREVLYGRGAVDAKGPLACFVDAVAEVGQRDGWQLVVIGAVEEERDSDGARFIAERYRPDLLLVGEPNRWDRVGLGYKGSAWAEITVRREQAHTAGGQQTAAEAAVEAWQSVRAYVEQFNLQRRRVFDQLLVTLRGLESGEDGFQQWARLRLGVRLPLDLSPADWYETLRELLPGAELRPVGYPVPAWECEKNTAPVRALLHAIRSLGGAPSFVFKTGSSDLNLVAPIWKCPAAVYGPGDSNLDHTPHEHLVLEEYDRAVQVLTMALRRITESDEI